MRPRAPVGPTATAGLEPAHGVTGAGLPVPAAKCPQTMGTSAGGSSHHNSCTWPGPRSGAGHALHAALHEGHCWSVNAGQPLQPAGLDSPVLDKPCLPGARPGLPAGSGQHGAGSSRNGWAAHPGSPASSRGRRPDVILKRAGWPPGVPLLMHRAGPVQPLCVRTCCLGGGTGGRA